MIKMLTVMLHNIRCVATFFEFISGGRQELERTKIERDRSEELAKRMTKSLKERASEAMSADGSGESDAPMPNGAGTVPENGGEVGLLS